MRSAKESGRSHNRNYLFLDYTPRKEGRSRTFLTATRKHNGLNCSRNRTNRSPPRWRRANRSRSDLRIVVGQTDCRGQWEYGVSQRVPKRTSMQPKRCMESGFLREPPRESGQQHDLAPAVALLKHLERRTHISQREGCGDRHFQFTGGNQPGELRKDRSV